MAREVGNLPLPRSKIAEILKEVLPDADEQSEEAQMAFSQTANVFVSSTIARANEFACNEKRNTILHADVVKAIEEIKDEAFINSVKACYEDLLREKARKESPGGSEKGKNQECKSATKNDNPSGPAPNDQVSG